MSASEANKLISDEGNQKVFSPRFLVYFPQSPFCLLLFFSFLVFNELYSDLREGYQVCMEAGARHKPKAKRISVICMQKTWV